MNEVIVEVAIQSSASGLRGVVFDSRTGAVHAYLLKPAYRGEPVTLSNTASLAREMGFRLAIDSHAGVEKGEG